MVGSNDIITILPLLIFDVGVPFADNTSDIRLIVEWYITGNWKYATGMLIPFLLNVFANIYHWWKWDSKSEKKYTWLLIILQLWPIYRAIKLAIKIVKKIPGAEAEKKKFESEIVTLEPYLESLPSVVVMSMALMTANASEQNKMAVLGDSPNQFYVTFSISIFTSTLGITKYLLKGPFRVLPEKGCLSGMITCRFLNLFLTVICTVMGKILNTVIFTTLYTTNFYNYNNQTTNVTDFGSILEHGNKPNNQSITTDFDQRTNVNSTDMPFHFENFYDILPLVFVLAVMIIPQVIITMIGLMRATGSMKRCLTFLSGHPQVIFLAIFTHFVISRSFLRLRRSVSIHSTHSISDATAARPAQNCPSLICIFFFFRVPCI